MTYFNDPETVGHHHFKRALQHKMPNLGNFQFVRSPEDFTTYLYIHTTSGISIKVALDHMNLDKLSIQDIFQHIDEQYPELNI